MSSKPATTELSAQEKRILGLIAKGLPLKEVAVQLSIGLETVKSYERRIRTKYRLQGRAAPSAILLVHRAIEDRIFVPEVELDIAEDPELKECTAELPSWPYFRPEAVNFYYMRCHLLGPHDEHENSETGAKWARQAGD